MTCVACCPFVTVIINQRNSPLVWICSDGRWMMRGSRICGVFAFGVLWVQVFLFFWRNLIIFQIINQFQNRLGLLRDKIQNPNLVSSYGSTELVSYELSTTAVFFFDPIIGSFYNPIHKPDLLDIPLLTCGVSATKRSPGLLIMRHRDCLSQWHARCWVLICKLNNSIQVRFIDQNVFDPYFFLTNSFFIRS